MTASIVTFYSFKGGVGRTQAVANVAVALAQHGYRSILVDMDLESPGLHSFFGPEPAKSWSSAHLTRGGVLDFFARAAEFPTEEPRFDDFLLKCRHPLLDQPEDTIRLLLPGRLDEDYPARVAGFSWDDFYRDSHGYDLVEVFRRQLVQSDVDYILIDSRTGMTDVAGICTFQLPDIVVALFALHQQGIDGIHQVAEAIALERKRADENEQDRLRALLLIPARVDEIGEISLRDEWMRRAELRMRDVDGEFLGERTTWIPYEPRVAFGEQIVVGAEPSGLWDAYEHLAEKLLERTGRRMQADGAARLVAGMDGGDWETIRKPGAHALTHDAARRIKRHALTLATTMERIEREISVIREEMRPLFAELEHELPTVLDVPSGSVLGEQLDWVQRAEQAVESAWRQWREGWLVRFRNRLAEVAEGDDAPVTEALEALELLLLDGKLDEAKEQCERKVAEIRYAASRSALLSRNELEYEQLRRVEPDSNARVQWLYSKLNDAQEQLAGDGESEIACATMHNCLRLLVREEVPTSKLWTFYDALCSELPDSQHFGVFQSIGVSLSEATWKEYLGASKPSSPHQTWSTSSIREQIRNAAEAELLEPMVAFVRDGIVKAWERWKQWPGERKTAFSALFQKLDDDPVVVRALASLPADTDLYSRLAIYAFLLQSAGIEGLEFKILDAYLDALREAGLIAEAFCAAESVSHYRPDRSHSDVDSRLILDLGMLAARKGNPGLVQSILVQPVYREKISHYALGRLFVLAIIGDFAASCLISIEQRQVLLTWWLHEREQNNDPFKPDEILAVQSWLGFLERYPDWDSFWGQLQEQRRRRLDACIDAFQVYRGWEPGLLYEQYFKDYWNGIVNDLYSKNVDVTEVKPISFDEWLKQAVKNLSDKKRHSNVEPVVKTKNRMQEAYEAVEVAFRELVEVTYDAGQSLRVIRELHDTHREARDAILKSLDGASWIEAGDIRLRSLLTDEIKSNSRLCEASEPIADAISSLFTVSPLLLRFVGIEPWRNFFDDLMCWSIEGESFARGVAREYVRSENFCAAAQVILDFSWLEDEAVYERLVDTWNSWYQRHKSVLVALHKRAAAFETKVETSSLVAEAHSHLEQVEKLLNEQDWTGDDYSLLSKLAEVGSDWFEQVVKETDNAKIALELADEEIQERQQQQQKTLIETKKRINELVDALLLEPKLGTQAVAAGEKANQLFRERNLSSMRELLQQLSRLQGSEATQLLLQQSANISVPVVEARQARNGMPLVSSESEHLRLARKTALRRIGFDALPELSELILRDLRAEPPPMNFDTGAVMDDFYPGRTWAMSKLRKYATVAHNALYKHELDEQCEAEEALGTYAAAQAQIFLLEREFVKAGLLFADTLAWLSWKQAVSGTADVNLRRWNSPCLWGITLAFLIPYLDEIEQSSIVIPDNLKALFYHPFEEIPLGSLDFHELFDAYGRRILELDARAGADMLRYFIRPYLREHSLAEQDFATGIFSHDQKLSVSLQLAIVLLETLVPDVERDLQEIANTMSGDSEVPHKSNILGQIRACFAAYSSVSTTVEAMLTAVERLEERREASKPSSDRLVSSSLLTKSIVLSPDIATKLVLVVTGQPEIETLYHLRVDVSLLDEQERQIPRALASPLPIARIRAGERHEIPVAIRDVQLASDARRVRVRYSRADAVGNWHYVKVATESFSIGIKLADNNEATDHHLPYVVGKPIQQGEGVYGRQDELQSIFECLQGARQDNVVFVLGDRRIGKTTLLNAILDDHRRKERYPLGFKLDQQDLDHYTTNFFARIQEEVRNICEEHSISLVSLDGRGKAGDLNFSFRRFMSDVDRMLVQKDKRMLIILDELEKVYQAIYQSRTAGLPREVMGALRSVIQDSQRVSFILAGVTDVLRPYVLSPEERLFKMAFEIELDGLKDKAARQIIEEPAKNYYEVAAPAANYVVEQAGGQPLLLQRIGAELFRYTRRQQISLVTQTDVEEVLRTRILSDTGAFAHLIVPWREKEVYPLLKALAHLQSGRRFVSVDDLQRRLSRLGAVWDEDDLTERLHTLCEELRTVIERSRASNKRFRLKIPLFARYIRWLDRPGNDLLLRI